MLSTVASRTYIHTYTHVSSNGFVRWMTRFPRDVLIECSPLFPSDNPTFLPSLAFSHPFGITTSEEVFSHREYLLPLPPPQSSADCFPFYTLFTFAKLFFLACFACSELIRRRLPRMLYKTEFTRKAGACSLDTMEAMENL